MGWPRFNFKLRRSAGLMLKLPIFCTFFLSFTQTTIPSKQAYDELMFEEAGLSNLFSLFQPLPFATPATPYSSDPEYDQLYIVDDTFLPVEHRPSFLHYVDTFQHPNEHPELHLLKEGDERGVGFMKAVPRQNNGPIAPGPTAIANAPTGTPGAGNPSSVGGVEGTTPGPRPSSSGPAEVSTPAPSSANTGVGNTGQLTTPSGGGSPPSGTSGATTGGNSPGGTPTGGGTQEITTSGLSSAGQPGGVTPSASATTVNSVVGSTPSQGVSATAAPQQPGTALTTGGAILLSTPPSGAVTLGPVTGGVGTGTGSGTGNTNPVGGTTPSAISAGTGSGVTAGASSSPGAIGTITSAPVQGSTQIGASPTTPGGSSDGVTGPKTTIRQYSPGLPSDASADFVSITLPNLIDAFVLETWPTNMTLINSLIANQLLGYIPGYVQVDKCAYELLETCKPPAGSKTCSLEYCTLLCNTSPKCQRITFASDGLCRLETRACQKQDPVASSNSFIKVSNVYIQFPGNCPNNYIIDGSLDGDQRVGCSRCTIEECRSICDILPTCIGLSYALNTTVLDDANKQCYVKQDVCTSPIHGTHIFYQKLPLYV